MVTENITAGIHGRPSGLPVYGLTARGRVHELVTLSPRQWEKVDIRSVTGLIPDGWSAWHPLAPDDKDRVLVERKRLIEELKAKRAAKSRRPPQRYRRPKRGTS
jgi:hypothetical protein